MKNIRSSKTAVCPGELLQERNRVNLRLAWPTFQTEAHDDDVFIVVLCPYMLRAGPS